MKVWYAKPLPPPREGENKDPNARANGKSEEHSDQDDSEDEKDEPKEHSTSLLTPIQF